MQDIKHIIRQIISENGRQLGKNLSDIYGEKFVTIYRAVKNGVINFVDNDYVTSSKPFAVDHAENNHIYYDTPFQVIRTLVSTKNLHLTQNVGSSEMFYSGPDKKGSIIYITKGDDYPGYEELTKSDFLM